MSKVALATNVNMNGRAEYDDTVQSLIQTGFEMDNDRFDDRSPQRHILDDVQAFAGRFGLMHKIAVLRTAALLLHNETPLDQIAELSTYEINALKAETTHKWHQPRSMYLTIIVTALGAMGQGRAQTSMNGANLYFPKTFGIDSGSSRDSFIIGLINSGIYLSSGLLGAWLVAPLNSTLGRRGAVFAAAVVSLIFNLSGALAQDWCQLLFFRLLLGCALSVISSTLNIFAAECAPAVIRGGLAVSWQMFCAFGIFVGFVANVAVYDVSMPARSVQ